MTADAGNAALTAGDLRRRAQKYWEQEHPQAALDAAWKAFERGRDERATKQLLVNLLVKFPTELTTDRRAAYLALLTDCEVAPDFMSAAGWHLVLRDCRSDADEASLEVLVQRMERDALALALLREAPVSPAMAERLLSRVRRWLLVSGRWRAHPEFVIVLKAQASLNGGAWPFDDIERGLLEDADNADMIDAYLAARPPQRTSSDLNSADAVTRAVAAQYEGWPYPPWTRITRRDPKRLRDEVHALDAEAAAAMPDQANILIAGCGTGRDVATVAQNFPDATITAIDVSEPSLAYARRRCSELGIAGVKYLKLDLHDVAALGATFHAIYCLGVLHHLPDPERGLRVLSGVLRPGGVMRILIYSRVERLGVAGARTLIRDLVEGPVSDDMLRRVRQRLLQSEHPLAARMVRSPDFPTLAGTHDMLLHRHEDPFDLPRLQQALKDAGLRMLAFNLGTPPVAARYDAMFPNDPKHHDIESLMRFERNKDGMFVGNYEFWCQKSVS